MKAIDFLSPGESAVVLFTDGSLFRIGPGGVGSTGNWKIDPKKRFDKVIIYQREDAVWDDVNEIFLADFAGIDPSPEEGRQIIRLANIIRKGTTSSNWHEFADSSQNPVRYIRRP